MILSRQKVRQRLFIRKASKIPLSPREQGSLAYDGTQFIYSPAFPAVVKNTAGAGDAFNGALASGLAKGKSLASALCYASAFASLAVETPNASDMPENESVLHRIQRFALQTNYLDSLNQGADYE
jgi:sugar/nucleoside kinase (ribokinase family)